VRFQEAISSARCSASNSYFCACVAPSSYRCLDKQHGGKVRNGKVGHAFMTRRFEEIQRLTLEAARPFIVFNIL
jgi:hypothetical protein